jgi:hypothetical protein
MVKKVMIKNIDSLYYKRDRRRGEGNEKTLEDHTAYEQNVYTPDHRTLHSGKARRCGSEMEGRY